MSELSGAKKWYVDDDGKPAGPFSTDELRAAVGQGRYGGDALVYGHGLTQWTPISLVPELGIGGLVSAPPPIPKTTFHRAQLAHEIDFTIGGEEMQYIEIELDPGEAVVAEAGAMMYMTEGIQMETVFGDGSDSGPGGGLFDKLVGAGKRLLTGESLFMTVFTNQGRGKQHVTFAAPYPGKIIPVNLAEMGGHLICQKDAFLCAAKGVAVSIAFQKRIGVALFGGEGFIMQKLEGDGLAFVHAGGSIINRRLEAGETLRVDTGCLVALEPSVRYDIESVGGVKSAIFGGEGFFFAALRGPGNVWLQTLPFSRLAGRIWSAAPRGGGAGKGEGSVLGQLGGIGGFFDGD